MEDLKRMLIVDDEKDVLDLVPEYFREKGWRVDTAEDGDKAMDKVKQNLYDVVLLDIRMPGPSGLEILPQMKKINEKLCIIMITAVGTIEKAVEALKNGAANFITKELDLDQLKIIIEKELEHERLSRLVRKLSSFKDLALGVAHQIKNVLWVISGRAQLLLEAKEIEETLKSKLEIIQKQASRADYMIRQLLDFSRGEELIKFVSVEVHNLLEGAILLAQQQLPVIQENKYEIKREYGQEIPDIKADTNTLREVIVNLIQNAYDSMPEGGTVTITTSLIEDKVEIKIADTGMGISVDNQMKIFEPFFTTKDNGIGLGLAFCFGIIQEHHGSIDFETQVNKGTTFIIKLPVYDKEDDKNG